MTSVIDLERGVVLHSNKQESPLSIQGYFVRSLVQIGLMVLKMSKK